MGGRGVSSFLSQINSKFSVTTNPCLTIYPLMGRMLNYYLLSSFFSRTKAVEIKFSVA